MSMTTLFAQFTNLSDTQLLAEVRMLANHERAVTAQLIASLAELDARRLYLGEGFSSLFTYCTQALHLSEHAAYGRIEAARAARQFPAIFDLLADGSITLTTVLLLGPHLTADNHQSVLNGARHKSRREVEHIVADIRPKPPIQSSVRKLPMPRPMPAAPMPDVLTPCAGAAEPIQVVRSPEPVAVLPKRLASVTPTAPEQYGVHMTISRETYDKLRRAQELIRHTVPSADPAVVIDRALTLLVTELEKAKVASTTRPRVAREAAVRSRHIPAAIKREVWRRDGGQCAFTGAQGRCTERAFLEFHHVLPYVEGGAASVDNLQLRCRAHNAYEAQRHFGPLLVRERWIWWEPGSNPVHMEESKVSD